MPSGKLPKQSKYKRQVAIAVDCRAERQSAEAVKRRAKWQVAWAIERRAELQAAVSRRSAMPNGTLPKQSSSKPSDEQP